MTLPKPLSDMTLEELWQLFPIILEKHHACWKDWYTEELHHLTQVLPAESVHRITHIGSTAIPEIGAKPIIDIMVETKPESDWDNVKERLTENGYLCMSETPDRLSFNKGYTEHGFASRVFHLHLRRQGDNDELYFRDYLAEHPQIAKEYESLKLTLWEKYEHNRDAYTEGKTEFIRRYTCKARELYAKKYEQ